MNALVNLITIPFGKIKNVLTCFDRDTRHYDTYVWSLTNTTGRLVIFDPQ